jgi:hypothetical protein
METAESVLTVARWWVYIGLATAAAFLGLGLDRLEESARGAFVFRVLIIPGLVLIWPLVIWRWWLLESGKENAFARHRPLRRHHGWAAALLAAAIPIVLLAALILGSAVVDPMAPVRLTEMHQ